MSLKPTRHVVFEIPRDITSEQRRALRDTAKASGGCVEYDDNYLVVENNTLGLFYVNKLLGILGRKLGKYGVTGYWLDKMSSADFNEAIEREEDFERFQPTKKLRSPRKSSWRSLRGGFRRT